MQQAISDNCCMVIFEWKVLKYEIKLWFGNYILVFTNQLTWIRTMKRISLFLLTAISILTGYNAHAATVDVTYTVTDRGNYVPPNKRFLLDFTVTNNIPSSYGQEIYTFGVDIPTDSLQVYPSGWVDSTAASTNWSGFGGSNISYESNWLSVHFSYDISSGDSLSGFIVHTGAIPAQINFYAFGKNGIADYDKSDAFYQGRTPGFEGTAYVSAVPIPSAILLFGSGLIGLIGIARRQIITTKC